MSDSIPVTSLSGVAINQSVHVDISKQIRASTLPQRNDFQWPHLTLYNESPAGLRVVFDHTQDKVTVPAGGWLEPWPIDPDETGFTATVLYIIQVPSGVTAPVNVLLGDLYQWYEKTPSVRVLGNSPIGIANTVSSLTTKIPINTTGGNVVGIEFGPDVNSGSDWEFICGTNGDMLLWDNKNARTVWTGRLADGFLGAKTFHVEGDAGAANLDILDMLNTHASGRHWGLFLDGDNALHLFNFTDSVDILLGSITGGSTWPGAVSLTGGVLNVGGQATAGNFGVPVIVAQTPTAGVNVTTTGVQTLFSFTPPANGLYELRGTFVQANGSASTYDFWASYADPVTLGNPKASLITSQGAIPLIAASFGISTGTSVPCAPTTFNAQGPGHPINVQFNDHAGTPNDTVYAQLWRLS